MVHQDMLLVELDELGDDPQGHLERARALGRTLVVTLGGKPQITIDDPDALGIVEAEFAARRPAARASVMAIAAAGRASARRLDLSA